MIVNLNKHRKQRKRAKAERRVSQVLADGVAGCNYGVTNIAVITTRCGRPGLIRWRPDDITRRIEESTERLG